MKIDDGRHKSEYWLRDPRKGHYISRLVWREMDSLGLGEVRMVLALHRDDEADYYRDHDEFLKAANGGPLMIPFLDLGAAYRELKADIDAAIQRVLDSGWYILGPEVEAFETEWAAYCGAEHAVGVANGLDALILSRNCWVDQRMAC